ncbi:MAG: helix-turn-helix domain-containing protein [Candidatus Odinarchaeota archaeon]
MAKKKYPIPPDNETGYLKLIENGESETCEFKSTFKYDIRENRANNDLTHLVSIAVCAFLNSRGGILFIGVEDNKSIIGLDYDLKILKSIDILQQEIPKIIRNDLGGLGILFDLEIEQLKGKLVCIISVEPSEKPIFFNNNEYYVRKGTQNQSLNPKETYDHISVRYKNIIVDQEKINRNREKILQDFINDLQERNYESILNKFNNKDYREPFKSLFTEIKTQTGAIILISNSFLIAIGFQQIFDIKPIYHKEKHPDWDRKSLNDKVKIWLDDFIERVKQVLNLDIG